MSGDEDRTTEEEAREHLAIYLNDHLGGSEAGVSLAQRCRRSNEGTELGAVLGAIQAEIEADQRTLEELMIRLGVGRNRLKQALGSVAELAARVKSNGHIVHYSPLSRVVELEALAAGIVTKRSLWDSLRAVADQHAVLDAVQLDALIARATSQYERVIAQKERAAAIAFSGSAGTAAEVTSPAAPPTS